MHQIRFRLGLRSRPRWGAYSAPQTPNWILGVLLLRKGREEKRGGHAKGRVKGGVQEGKKRKGKGERRKGRQAP